MVAFSRSIGRGPCPFVQTVVVVIAWLSWLPVAIHAQAQPSDPLSPASSGGSGGRQVSIAAQNADLRAVLQTLARQAGLDFVADPDVAGTVTVDLADMPLDQALEAVLSPRDFGFEIEDGVLRIYGRGMQTRIFSLDYTISVRTGLTRLTASSGGGGETSAGQSGSGSADAKSSFSVDSQSTSDPWAEIIRGLELIVFGQASGGSPDTPERLVVHPASGVVLVRADILTLNRVADFLEKISGSVHRQVQIDVRIIEVTLKDGHEVGIDWSRLPIASNSLASLDDDVAVAQHLSPNHEVFQIAASMGEFDALLDALETQGRIKVVSAPTVATLN